MKQLTQHWSIILGLLLGGLVIPISWQEWQRFSAEREAEFQRGTPVIESHATIVERGADSLLINVVGHKLRECDFIGLQAYTVDASGVMSIADISRIGPIPARAQNRPVGPFDSGVWRIWPVGASPVSVVVYAMHQCEGIDVRSVFAQVQLDGRN